MAIADDFIKPCYANGQPIPNYWISGEVCPPPGQYINLNNCKDVGVADGLQNILYWGWLIGGTTFQDIAEWFASTPFVLILIPGADAYMRATMASFRLAGPTMRDRMRDCSIVTAPSVVPIALALFLAGMVLFFVVPAVVRLAVTLVNVFLSLPLISDEVPGEELLENNNNGGGGDIDEDDDDEDDDEMRPKPVASSFVDFLFSGSRGRKEKTE